MVKQYEMPDDKQDDDDFVAGVQREYRLALDKTGDWRNEVEAAYDFVSGDQWSDEDKAKLEDELRPITTFNRMDVFVSAVTGLEIINREEIRYLPRVPGEANQGRSDILNDAVKYVTDDTDGETAYSEAFWDLALGGMGWTDTRLNFDTNPEGDIEIERLDPLNMYWDPRATKKNLDDTKWRAYLYKISMEDVKDDWPEKSDDIEYSRIFDPGYELQRAEPHHADKAWMYARDQARRVAIPDEVYIFRYQYYVRKPFHRVWMPDGTVQDISPREWRELQENIQPEFLETIRSVKMNRRQFRQAYIIGDTLLEDEELPVQDGFTLQAMTGKRDRNDNTWYGLFRAMRDPQEWLNKFFSQILHIINSNAKGGLMAEKDAFDNPNQAQRDWSKPDRITWMKRGAIQEGKILQKQPIQYPQGTDRLMQFSMQMFHDVTGINLELLGLASRNQPGILESQRKEAGITLLAWCFDAMRAYKRKQGRILAEFIREYIADGRLIRVSTQGNDQYVPLVRDDLSTEYDIVVSTSPHSASEKERVFAIMMEMMPTLVNMGATPPAEIFDYIPLPAVVANAWKQSIEQGRQSQAQAMQAQQQMEQQQLQSEGMKDQAKAARDQAEAAEAQSDALLNQARAQSEQAGPQFKATELQIKQAQVQAEILKNLLGQ